MFFGVQPDNQNNVRPSFSESKSKQYKFCYMLFKWLNMEMGYKLEVIIEALASQKGKEE